LLLVEDEPELLLVPDPPDPPDSMGWGLLMAESQVNLPWRVLLGPDSDLKPEQSMVAVLSRLNPPLTVFRAPSAGLEA
jgi:hypothetical protein